jgi:hydroxymethylpyrimidine/phosphomethylpyrimidine kinase
MGVMSFEALPADIVTAQIEAVVSDIGAHSAKTGMLANAAIVEAVAAAVQDLEIPLLVVDPVMTAKSGHRLLDDDAIGTMKTELFRNAFVVTPNIPEAEMLTGGLIRNDKERREAAQHIVALGARSVILKGGHLATDDIRDLLFDGHAFTEFRHERVPGRSTHGTGCTFASALTSHLALGRSLLDAIPLAQRYVAGAIRNAPGLGRGQGPVDHFWERQGE